MIQKPSFFLIEQYLAGELDVLDSLHFESMMELDPVLKSYVQSQRAIHYEGSLPGFQQAQAPVYRTPSVRESFVSAFRRRFNEMVSPLLPPQMGWAMGLCLIAGAILVLSRPNHLETGVSEFTAKGSSMPFRLRVSGGADLRAEQQGFAHTGDTLSFVYRGSAGMHVQVWYQDDGGEIQPYLAPSSHASSWPGASAWREADYKVVLFSGWKKESVWVLWSDRDFTSQEARKTLEGGAGGNAIQKTAFHIVHSL